MGVFGHPARSSYPSDRRTYGKCSPGNGCCRIDSLPFTTGSNQTTQELGFVGPYTGPDHAFMFRGTNRVRIPNPHKKEIGVNLLLEIFEKAGLAAKSGFQFRSRFLSIKPRAQRHGVWYRRRRRRGAPRRGGVQDPIPIGWLPGFMHDRPIILPECIGKVQIE